MTDAWSLRMPGESDLRFDGDVFMRTFPELQAYDVDDQDVTIDGVDGRQFGTDSQTGPTFAITFGVTSSTEFGVRDLEDELKRRWRGDSVRRTVGAVGELVSDRGRRSFGRPRRIATSATGYANTPPSADLSAEWIAVDALWYGELRTADVGIVPTPTGGLQEPLVAPLTVGNGPSTQAATFHVDSRVTTWPTVRVRGAINNPGVRVIGEDGTGFTFTFPTDVAYDDGLTVSTAPWARGATRDSTGALVPLGPGSSRFDAAALTAGTYELVLSGTAMTGTPRAFVDWRDANTNP